MRSKTKEELQELIITYAVKLATEYNNIPMARECVEHFHIRKEELKEREQLPFSCVHKL